MNQKFTNMTAEVLAQETQFIDWVRGGAVDADWNSWYARLNTGQRQQVDSARELVRILINPNRISTMNTQQELVLWDRIQSTISNELPKKRSGRIVNLRWIMGIAASVVLLVLSIPYLQSSDTVVYAENETKNLVLPAESQVQLSKGSKLTYSPEGWTTQRQVSLEGEAFFDVSKGASFIVATRTGNVEVIGTSFLVSDMEEGLAVMVESGIVKVTTSAYSEQLERGDSYLLNPTLSSISNLGTGTTYFKFIDRPIGEALDILSSMYELQLEISEVDRARRLTGFFASTDASALAFQKICSTVNLTFDMRDGVIRVS